jgi:hypothetical protein
MILWPASDSSAALGFKLQQDGTFILRCAVVLSDTN